MFKINRDNTPTLVNAIVSKDIELARQLLNEGADPHLPDKTGFSPYTRAKNIGLHEFLQLFNEYYPQDLEDVKSAENVEEESDEHPLAEMINPENENETIAKYEPDMVFSETPKLLGSSLFWLGLILLFFIPIIGIIMIVVGSIMYASSQKGCWLLLCPVCQSSMLLKGDENLAYQENVHCAECNCVSRFYKGRFTHIPPSK